MIESPPPNKSCLSSVDITKDLLFGAIAGMAAKTVIAPIDRVKIHFQTRPILFTYRRFLYALSSIIRNEGFFALWRGNSPMLLRVLPFSSIQLTVFDTLRVYSDRNEKKLTRYAIVNKFIIGSLSGLTATIITYPLDICRARMIISKNDLCAKNILSVLYSEVCHNRARYLYQGLIITLFGSFVYSGIGFAIFETLRLNSATSNDNYQDTRIEHNNIKIGSIKTMLFGSIAGLVSQIASYPIDIVRRNYQVFDLNNEGKKPNLSRVFVSICSQKNRLQFRMFYKALSLNFLKAPIGQGVALSIFLSLKNTF